MEIVSLLLALFSGIAAGVVGVMPFLHANSLVNFFSSNPFFTSPLHAAVFFAALGAAHLVFASFPAVFFGLPSAGQAISVLPAHSLALRGRGFEALQAMLYAIFGALLLALALSPAFHFFSKAAYPFFAPFVLPALLAVVALFFVSEKNFSNAVAGAAIFLLSGFFGFIVLSFSFVADPLLPLLTGLFGLPLLLLSFSSSNPPKQELGNPLPTASKAHMVAGVLLGGASTFIPAVSPAVASSAAFLALGESSPLNFLALSTAVSASKAVFDVGSVFSIGKARSGVAAAVSQNISGFGEQWIVLLAVGVAGFAALALAFLSSRKAVALFSSLHGRKVSLLVLFAAIAGLHFSGGAVGVAIAVVACLLGLIPSLGGLRHAYLTGALILPTILHYSGFSHQLVSLLLSL